MIPKIIHYCWFGKGEKSKLAQECIASWKKYMPDYEIIEWNEDNFDINTNEYTKMCYEQKKYAFLTDYLRLLIVKKYGGIYFDTDVEVLRNFDELLKLPAFFGFENDTHVASGLGFGAEAGNEIVSQMVREYDGLLDGLHGTIGCPVLNTEALLKFGLKLDGSQQCLKDAMVFPVEYFNPMNSVTGKIDRTINTYSIHRYSMSWLPKHKQIRSKITQKFHRIFGEDCFAFLDRK